MGFCALEKVQDQADLERSASDWHGDWIGIRTKKEHPARERERERLPRGRRRTTPKRN